MVPSIQWWSVRLSISVCTRTCPVCLSVCLCRISEKNLSSRFSGYRQFSFQKIEKYEDSPQNQGQISWKSSHF